MPVGTIAAVSESPPRPFSGNFGAVFALAVLAISWGAVPLLVRIDVPPTQLVAMRVTLGGLFLLAVTLLRGRMRIPETHRWRLAVLGVLLAVHWLTFFAAIQLTTVATALAVVYLGPVLAAVLSGPVLGERVGWRAFAGLALALAGTLLVIRPGAGATAGGIAMALVSAVLLAILMIVGKPVAGALGGSALAMWELLVASVLLLPFTAAAVRDSAEYWAQFLVLGVLLTGVAGVVYWSSMRRIPVAVTSTVMYLEPASAVIWAALLLDESPAALTWAGVALVTAGGVLAAREAAEEGAIGAPATL